MIDTKEKLIKILPYLIVFFSFCIVVILLIVSVDSLLLPALIHNKDTVPVPNVTGMAITEAEKVLAQNNLVVYKVIEQYSDKIDQGTVITQMPKPSQLVKVGRGLYLTVSKGQETVTVPYLTGQSTRAARILLKNKGLEIGNIEYASSDRYGPDTVISQKRPSGQNIQYGSFVDIIVSKGSESQVKVPNIIGLSYEEASKVLSESGLVTGNRTVVRNETYQSNTVVNQNPGSGELVNKGTSVNITTSK